MVDLDIRINGKQLLELIKPIISPCTNDIYSFSDIEEEMEEDSENKILIVVLNKETSETIGFSLITVDRSLDEEGKKLPLVGVIELLCVIPSERSTETPLKIIEAIGNLAKENFLESLEASAFIEDKWLLKALQKTGFTAYAACLDKEIENIEDAYRFFEIFKEEWNERMYVEILCRDLHNGDCYSHLMEDIEEVENFLKEAKNAGKHPLLVRIYVQLRSLDEKETSPLHMRTKIDWDAVSILFDKWINKYNQ